MPNRPLFQPVALAGAVAISASLIGFAALPQISGPPTETRAVALASGETDLYLPNPTTFDPTVSNGFPPLFDVQQGQEVWFLSPPAGELAAADLTGTDTQTTIGSFVNNYFVESSETELGAVAPSAGSEIDLANFGGGYENELAYFLNGSGGYTVSDTLITPSGDYTFPLGSTVPEASAAVPADAFSNLLSSIEYTTGVGEHLFSLAETAFADGDYSIGVADTLNGFNDLSVGVSNDIVVNGYAFLAGEAGNAGYALDPITRPGDFTAGLTEAQEFLAQVQPLFADALTAFASGDGYSGLADLGAIGAQSSYATDAIILGLFDSLPGFAGQL